ncbi:4-hydroxy-3-methylbut-2-enyl diphosphate reductase [Francisella adeliensis]|uniref:4-hydroxy-3-methylbut-2-enyl diphosphate reductase n=1 Tax=Francisella adeliensis TaxID=2007306 RepID=A0A2Z4XXT6_9GAMM|nr:4-hydroxy-3-methylbut-2-enyl diphosphate reductase [Francisella adeliensis]AXA33215.1 4-hydroxy-3-methylbut-2-enyl diphosphate reductase [Francisella adeliensis]MBK2085064.1 4-hydroxy-3-methylbut-2-enyl diphosphate reductase [Francisella adeliensis]MBK2096945.1 4-hydroxy-3-methylbut-2-enyl diphosphate reductase [Francisella adeliensis]QIW11443.1 4-hydroxy-3-methylbut-2-enyl diphosphate reductase [Francisella adeliensis]QIW13318.1 4-hydroxy-3-methylbut-2-enyl diphosphate reductase [Francisel
MKILLANPRGFCAGVSRAVETVEKVLEVEKTPVYVRHEVVHNKVVVDSLKKKGVTFVKEIDEVPNDSVCIFSAHGVSLKVESEAAKKNLVLYDATCPLVTKVHRGVRQASNNDAECVLIGHKGHPEVQGTMGQYRSTEGAIYLVESEEDVSKLQINNPQNLYYATQTTLSVDETQGIIASLKSKYPAIKGPKKEDICYATQNRQTAIKSMLNEIDVLVVVGSQNSSNSNRLRELASNEGIDAYLVDNVLDINKIWFDNKKSCGVSAGASAPEYLVQDIITKISQVCNGNVQVEDFDGIKEEVYFPLPRLLKQKLVKV